MSGRELNGTRAPRQAARATARRADFRARRTRRLPRGEEVRVGPVEFKLQRPSPMSVPGLLQAALAGKVKQLHGSVRRFPLLYFVNQMTFELVFAYGS